ncbi:hypothetical protein Gotri_010108 [Gossypium trilobum]|uniref:Uncharacterized protein n=1 Tax=Gossypium trilobum TaxID=34281 RepID=A0A7J9EQ19_9ROSI|nr:hypothetical protein [Gossypium trilobum]
MVSNDRNFDAGSCNVSDKVDLGAEKNITCTCQNDTCHVTHIKLSYYSLLELTKLSFSSFVFVNRLSGSIPTYLGNITSLAYL